MYLKSIATTLIMILLSGAGHAKNAQSATAVYKQLTAVKCDSLVRANLNNPDFVILDVRTPGEYTPDHLEGAINRNVNDANFTSWMNQLSKQKIYLLHCQSGGRSAGAFNTMKTLQFNEVYEMISGMNAWKSAGYSTTSKFAPKLMIATKGPDTLRSVRQGTTDTLKIRITNRANDTLKFTPVTPFSNPEFSTDFNSTVKLAGSQDYTFKILFTPADLLEHSVKFSIVSNGGNEEITLNRKATSASGINPVILQDLVIYPNPASGIVYLKNLPRENLKGYTIINLNGQLVQKARTFQSDYIDVSTLQSGIYILGLELDGSVINRVITVQR